MTYPTIHRYFGSEPKPAVDRDGHIVTAPMSCCHRRLSSSKVQFGMCGVAAEQSTHVLLHCESEELSGQLSCAGGDGHRQVHAVL
jgi:hypothetical protein